MLVCRPGRSMAAALAAAIGYIRDLTKQEGKTLHRLGQGPFTRR